MYSIVYYNIYDQIQTSILARNIIVSKNYMRIMHTRIYAYIVYTDSKNNIPSDSWPSKHSKHSYVAYI